MKLPIVLACIVAAAMCRASDTNAPALPQLPSENRPLAERFANPPASARILPIIHKQHDDPAKQDKQLQQLAARGFGGFAGNVSFDGYVDDETKWPAFLRGVRMARDAGMSLWLYDECGYPSGSARDLTLRGHPEWAARGLLVAVTNSTGGEVSLALPPGKLVSAVALPVRDGIAALDQATDLAASVSAGQLRWQAPSGNWQVLAMTDDLIYSNTHAGISLAFKKPCINLLMPEPTKRFLEVTHDEYAKRLDRNLGKYFVSTFTDEPSLQNYWFKPMPYLVLPWSDTLAKEFKKRRGDKLEPLLPALVIEAGPRGAKARYDFWQTIGELVSENYFGQIQDWCHRHQIASGGHLLIEESLVAHVPFYGDFFRCARRLDAPSSDCLTSIPSEVPWYIARMISSIADLEGRKVTMCEVSDHSQRYRPAGDTRPVRVVTEDEIRGTCNRLIWGGISALTSYYQFGAFTDEQLRDLNTWIGRCSTMLAGGQQVADIAVLYPIETLWPKFVPSRNGATEAAAAHPVERIHDNVSSTLYAANRDFTYIDARALTESKARGDALRHGQLNWRVLVLPAVETLPIDAWKNIERFWRSGGIVIAVGARPANSETEFPSPRITAAAREIFGDTAEPSIIASRSGGVGIFLPTGMTALLPRLIDTILERDATTGESRGPVRITHRRIEDHDVYFAINDSASPWSGSIRFAGGGVSEQWDPATGAMTPLPAATNIALQLGPYRAMLFRAAEISAPLRKQNRGGIAPAFKTETLPTGKPTIGKGQFVEATHTGDDNSGWCAAAKVTKTCPDTHLFQSFAFPQPIDLSTSDGLLIETTVPDARQVGVELLIQLHASDGGHFLASTGRTLGTPTPGTARSYLLFDQFHHAGWSQKGKDVLDLTQIAAISIGWGGHPGTEGETITFTARPPQRFTCTLEAK